MIYPCPTCRESVNVEQPGQYLCPHCGASMACGQISEPMPVIRDYQRFDPRPFIRPSLMDRNTRSDKSRVGFVLLGLFFGMMGIHNFYAGHAGRGIAQLLITLFLWWLIVPIFVVAFWVLIEVCVVNRDGNGRRMV